nr:MFS transporter [Cupriavidus sp. LEh25]
MLIGLPSGALADSLDRKTYLLVTQIWVAGTASLLSAASYLGWMTPPVLLALVFANGIGLAMRMPVLGAALPEVVPRAQLPAATALSAVSVNASRILGPILAGLLISSAGTAAVFLLNAILSIIAAWMVSRWKSESARNRHGRERMFNAMRAGLQYVAQSSQLKGVLWRLGIFFHCSTALMCMLPLLVRQLKGGGAGAYTLLIASMGAGAIGSAHWLPRLRERYSRDSLVLRGTAVQAAAMIAMTVADRLWLAMPAMFIAGAAWITVGNTLTLASHQSLPNWVRARGISISQMTVMGASAMGAAVWGQIAAWTSVRLSLASAAALALIAIALVSRVRPDAGTVEDFTPKRISPMPEVENPPVAGHVMVTIEYSIDASRASEFRALMLNEGRSSRFRHGAISWELLHDLHEPGRFVEIIVDPSWNDHLRRLDRITNSDAELRDRKLSFHIAKEEPRIRHSLMESTVKVSRLRM